MSQIFSVMVNYCDFVIPHTFTKEEFVLCKNYHSKAIKLLKIQDSKMILALIAALNETEINRL